VLASGLNRLLQLIAGARRRTLVLNLSGDAPTVVAGPVLLRSVYVHTVMSAHAVGFSDGGTEKFIAPALSGAGANLLSGIDGGIKFEEDMTITPNVNSTGVLVITYDEL